MGLGSSSPIYDVLLLAHVGSAIAGFGANGLAGFYGNQLSSSPKEAAVKYFDSPRFIAEKFIYLVPVFGLSMIAISHGVSELQKPWVVIGIFSWLIAIGVAHGIVWPVEREIAQKLKGGFGSEEIQVLSKKLSRGALILDLVFVFAFVMMFLQIGGK